MTSRHAADDRTANTRRGLPRLLSLARNRSASSPVEVAERAVDRRRGVNFVNKSAV